MPDKINARRFPRSKPFEFLVLLIVAVVVAAGVRTFLVQTFYIPSGSMENTLLLNDKVLVNKAVYRFRDPARGEIVVFEPPVGWGIGPSEQEYIKRVIGIGGDRVVCCDADKRITVNGHALVEDYLFPGDAPSDEEFDVTVPAGRMFMMGDHRSDSADSRAHMDSDQGTIPVDRVAGRAFAIYWPSSRWRSLSVPSTFDAIP
ncbi:signal peptidase I [Actinoplanes awajinensis]|uniref:Signal peptidase I n=1 Tax=Actinoplanes awajinensis subsp. mycoplanecinus TaxID=135947 RepID=A0A0X3V7C2_9ACTN|nr:signal peptidase I [Actinoplanes awajinensis]KUL40719.1 signal peptidase I [Actinoplanes awajinensis subsp. mycoplanecinus]